MRQAKRRFSNSTARSLTDSYTGFVNGDTSASLSTAPTNTTMATAASHVAGSPYAINVSGAADSDYAISYVAGSLTVTPAALTITANNQSKLYGAALPTLTDSYAGFVNGDTSASLSTAPTNTTTATASSHVAGSPYAIAASGAADSDYAISYVAGSLNVTPEPITFTAAANTKTYDGTISAAAAPTVTSGKLYDAATVSESYASKNAGAGLTLIPIVSIGNAGDYTVTLATSSNGVINPKAISAAATANSKTYDGTTADTGSAMLGAGVVSGDMVGLSGGTYAFTDKNAGTNKTVDVSGVSLTGADAGDYVISVPTTTLASIFQKALTLSLTGAVEKTYDGTTAATLSAANANLSGVIAGDNVAASTGTARYDTVHAGTGKTVTATGDGLVGADAANYSLTSTTTSAAVGVIDPRSVTITADNESKLFGQTDPTLDYTVSSGSIVAGDQTSGALARSPGQAPGAYAINQGTLGLSSDYAVSFNSGIFSIQPVATEGSIAGVTASTGGFTQTLGLAPGYIPQLTYPVVQTLFGSSAYAPSATIPALECARLKGCVNLPYPTNLEVAPGIRFVSGS